MKKILFYKVKVKNLLPWESTAFHVDVYKSKQKVTENVCIIS